MQGFVESTPIYSDGLASRRLANYLNRAMALSAILVAVATGVALAVSYRLFEQQAYRQELVFAAMASELPADRLGPMVTASGRTYLRIRDDDIGLGGLYGQAVASPSRQFNTVRGDQDWVHTRIAVSDGFLLVSRPTSAISQQWWEKAAAIGGLGATMLALVGGLFFLARWRLVRPARALADAGAELRVRGRMSEAVRAELDQIGPTPHEHRQIADNFFELADQMTAAEGQMLALANAGAGLGASLEPQRVLDQTLEHLERLLGVRRTAIIQLDPRTNTFEVVAARGHGPGYGSDLRLTADDSTLPSVRSLRERMPIQIPDSEAEVAPPTLRARARRHGYRSVLAVPLTAELEQPTVLLLHHDQPRTYSFDEVELSRSFAAIAGAALRNAELFASTDANLRSQTSRLEAIIGSVNEGLLVADDAGRVLFANSIMRRLLPSWLGVEEGMAVDTLLGAILTRTPDPRAARAALDRLASQASNGAHYDVNLILDDEGKSEDRMATYRVQVFEVRDARGQLIGRGQTWWDLSQERELQRMKNGLLATVSHEFRTPLTLIKGYATTLLANDVTWDPADRNEFLHLMSNEADRLTDLVKRILDMRRIDAGMVTLQPMPTTAASLVDLAVATLPHERDRIRIGPIEAVSVSVDCPRMVTALRNLIENACKYSPPDDHIEIWVRRTLDGNDRADDLSEAKYNVEISIRDRGPGIPEELRDSVFETFVRVENGLDAASGGIGLGLSIARGFVEAHDGWIELNNPVDGGPGTVFSVVLPLETVSAEQVKSTDGDGDRKEATV